MNPEMDEFSQCPRCGAPRNPKSSRGLCPFCVARVSFRSPSNTPADDSGESAGSPMTFGNFDLLKEAGRGAMGVVYRARQQPLGRLVALKVVLNGQFAGDSERRRFQTEAELVARLDHPNIVPIFEFGELDGRQFYAMRWLEGGPLQSGGDPTDAARLVAKVARAVHHAHQRGVLHRDLKPGNILFDDQGEPFVTDFGLSRSLEDPASLTGSHGPLGTPSFMAPEQASGDQPITVAADIWGLGAILCHLLTGRPPFQGGTVLETLSQVREGRVDSLRAWNPTVDPTLEIICLQCLRRPPTQRYASAADLAEDLERWLTHRPILARPLTRGQRMRLLFQRHPAAVATAAAVLILSGAGLSGILTQWHRAEREREQAKTRLLRLNSERAQRAVEAGDPLATLPWMVAALTDEPPASERATAYRRFLSEAIQVSLLPEEILFFGGDAQFAAFSPDGRHLVVDANEGGAVLVSIDTQGRPGSSSPIGPGGRRPAFAPDSQTIYCPGFSGSIRRFNTQGQPVGRDVVTQSNITEFALSRDGSRMATGSSEGIAQVWDSTSGAAISPPLRHERELLSVEFSPDGSHLATVANDRTLRLWDVTSGRELARRSGETFWKATFHPDGRHLLVASRKEHKAQQYDANTLEPFGPALRHEGYVNDVGYSPDGGLIATASFDHTARVWRTATGEPASPPLQHANEVRQLKFSGDGRSLATAGVDPSARVWDPRSGRPRTPWLRHGGKVLDLAFTPGDRHLLTTGEDGTARWWPLNPTVETPRVLPDQPRPIWLTRFSKDASRVLLTSRGRGRVWQTSSWQPLMPEPHHQDVIQVGRFSPDGTRLLTGSRDRSLLIWNWQSREPEMRYVHSNAVSAAVWLPDSRHVFSSGRGDDLVLWDTARGQVVHTFRQSRAPLVSLDASSEGRWLAAGSDHRVTVWEALSGQPVWEHSQPRNQIERVLFSPDGRWLASADLSGGVQLHESATGRLVAPPWQQGTRINEVLFGPDGRCLAVLSDGSEARVWDCSSGRPVTPSLRMKHGIAEIGFSPDGTLLFTSNPVAVQLWDARSGAPVSPSRHFGQPLSGGTFLDDRQAVLISEEGGVIQYEIQSFPWTPVELAEAASLLSGLKVDAADGTSPAPPAGLTVSKAQRQESEAAWHRLKQRLAEWRGR